MADRRTTPRETPLDGSAATEDVGLLENNMGLMFRDLYRLFNRALDEKIARFGVAVHTCRYLAIIADRGGATPKELSDFMGVRSPTAVGSLRVLEERGLVKRGADPDDGRKTVFRLTKRGVEVERLARECALQVERAATRSLTADQIAQFQGIIAVIREDLDEDLRSGLARANE